MKIPDPSQISPYLAELSRCGKALAEPEQSLLEKRVGFMEQNFTRIVDKEYRPTKAEMTDFIGEPAKGAWIELRRSCQRIPRMPSGIVFGGAKYDWGVRQLTGEQWRRAEVYLSERRRRDMSSQRGSIVIVELARKDAYLREIVSDYSSSHYYDVSVLQKSGSWRVELTRKPFENRLDKDYHGKLFEDHVEEPRVFAALLSDKQVGWIELGYDKWNNRMRVWEFLVEQEFRTQCIGTALMNHAVKIAKDKGARMLVLETQTNNATAIDFYLNFGFEFIGFDLAAYSNEDIKKKEVRLELGLKLP